MVADQNPLTVIIPAFNEEACIQRSLHLLNSYLSLHYPESEVILVDDGSSDGTLEAMQDWVRENKSSIFFKICTYQPNRGKGAAVKTGMLQAKGKIRIFLDADLPYNLDIIDSMVTLFSEGESIIIGNRNDPRSVLPKIRPFRSIAGKIYSLLVQLFIPIGISDSQCGIKGFSASAAEAIFSKVQIEGFGFDVEVLYIAQKLGFNIARIPVKMCTNRADSRVHLFSDSLRMLANLFQIRLNSHRGMYD